MDDTDLLLGLVNAISDMWVALDKITSSDNNNLTIDDEQFKAFFDRCTSTYLNISNILRIDEAKFDSVDGEDNGSGFEPSAPTPSSSSSKPESPSVDININDNSGFSGEEVVDDFVANSADIGVEGAEPAIEEI